VSHPNAMPPQAVLMQLVTGKCATQAVAAAVSLGIPDALAGGPRGVIELARERGANPDALERLLKALCLFGVLAEADPGVFVLTPVGDGLRTDAPGSVAGFARMFGAGWHHEIWAELETTVRTGKPAFLAKHPEGFGWFAANPREAGVFNDAMTSLSRAESGPVIAAHSFAGAKRICDVGGGRGFLLASILRAVPEAKGALYEMPHALEGARSTFASEGVADRAETIAGDFFQAIPPGFDHYVLKHILHDWDDEACVGILRRCAEGLTAGGTVVIVEQVLPARGSSFASVVDLEMLLMTPGGRERTVDGFAALFARAGLALEKVLPTPSPVSVILAKKT
jgi:C-methyltransferase